MAELLVLLRILAATLIRSGISISRNVVEQYRFSDMLNRLILIKPRECAGRICSVKEVPHALRPQANGEPALHRLKGWRDGKVRHVRLRHVGTGPDGNRYLRNMSGPERLG